MCNELKAESTNQCKINKITMIELKGIISK